MHNAKKKDCTPNVISLGKVCFVLRRKLHIDFFHIYVLLLLDFLPEQNNYTKGRIPRIIFILLCIIM